MAYTEGSMSTDELKKLFGDSLQVRDDGHVTFSNDGDADKFMQNSQLRDVFTGAMGRSEGDWDDGESSTNDLGTVVRYLSDGGNSKDEPEAEPDEQSEHLTTAKERVNEWQNRFDEDGNDSWSTLDTKKTNNQSDKASAYLNDYKLNLREKNAQRKDKAETEAM